MSLWIRQKKKIFKASNWPTIENIYISINTRLQIKRKDLFRNKETKDQRIRWVKCIKVYKRHNGLVKQVMHPPNIVAGKKKKRKEKNWTKWVEDIITDLKNSKIRRIIFQHEKFTQMIKNGIKIDLQFDIPFRNLITSKGYKRS